jgi:serine/threonine protein kinase
VCGIHWAAKWGNLNTLNLLLEPSATVDLQDNAAWTPLAYAICGKHIDVVKFLLSRHANPRAHSSGGKSLYQLATEEKFDEGAAALVGAGVVEPDPKRSEIRPGQIQDQNRSGSRIYDTPHAKYHNEDEVPFVAQRMLGMGSFGRVELVRARDSQLLLALKSYRITKRILKMQSRDYDNEVAIMQSLVHPHIARVVSTFETYVENVPKAFGILMVPVGEEDLHHFMERMGQSRPTPDDIRRLEGWMMCLATAVAYMHSRYIQHRDIKPQNVICKDDKLYFIDFHTSIDRSDSEYDYDSKGGKDVPRTVKWTAPEVQNRERVGFPADIFSLGALFSQMNTLISRRSLKDFDNFREQASPYHPEERFGAFHSSIGKVETWLGRKQVASNKLIIRMMSRKPQDRPTAFEVVSALRSINGFPNCDCILQVRPP